MEIIIQTDDELSDTDKAILRALLGDTEPEPAPKPKKAEAKPAPKPKPKPKAEEPEEEAEEPEPEDEDEPESEAEEEAEDDSDDSDDSGNGEVSMDTAVELATQLVSAGKSDVVKSILADLGVKRVSELDEDQLAAFVEAAS